MKNTSTNNNDQHQVSKEQTYYYCVPPGNYPATMRAVMNKRGNWVEVKEVIIRNIGWLRRGCRAMSLHIQTSQFRIHGIFSLLLNRFQKQGYDKIDKRLQKDSRPFIFNHFEIIRGLVTKTGLIRSLKTYYKSNNSAKIAGYSVFDSTPTTFLVSGN